MSIDLDLLEALAKAATPGPWENAAGYKIEVAATGTHCASAWERYTYEPDKKITSEKAQANATYIAAANPAVLLELIAELRAKNALLEEIFDDCWVKDSGACPVCHTYTHKHWCWYPQLAKMLGKPLDENDRKFLEEKQEGEQ